MKRIYIETLGCSKNTVYSEYMAGLIEDSPYQLTDTPETAEIIIINTCGFITAAKEESINTILALAELKDTTLGRCELLIAIGCMVQKYASELHEAMPEIDLLLGTTAYDEILMRIDAWYAEKTGGVQLDHGWRLPHVKGYMSRSLSTPKHYAYLSIAEGCNNRCSYCAIPDMQGPYRSRTEEDIMAEAKGMVAEGVQELIIIAQDTTYYGLDLYGAPRLASLLRQLCTIEDLRWIRILYAYPDHFTEELIQTIAEEPKICHYLDIPFQHIDDDILRSMRRNITKKDIRDLLNALRQAIPDIVIRSTFITGYPGETDEQYRHLLAFLKDVKLQRVGVFPYSQEDRTPAGQMPDQIPEEIREERAEVLMEEQYQIMYDYHYGRMGQVLDVVVEEKSEMPELLLCRSYGEAPDIDPFILVPGEGEIGTWIKVRITGVDEYDLTGVRIDEST